MRRATSCPQLHHCGNKILAEAHFIQQRRRSVTLRQSPRVLIVPHGYRQHRSSVRAEPLVTFIGVSFELSGMCKSRMTTCALNLRVKLRLWAKFLTSATSSISGSPPSKVRVALRITAVLSASRTLIHILWRDALHFWYNICVNGCPAYIECRPAYQRIGQPTDARRHSFFRKRASCIVSASYLPALKAKCASRQACSLRQNHDPLKPASLELRSPTEPNPQ